MKEIPNYNGAYLASEDGRIYSTLRNRFLTPYKEKQKGYMVVHLKDGVKKVHRLIAMTFLENPDDLPQVNHIDEDKTNNRLENLEWCDNEYNSNYGTKGERLSKALRNGKKSKKVLQYTLDGELVREWPSAMEAERAGFCHGHIVRCCNGNAGFKTHKGYIWKYEG